MAFAETLGETMNPSWLRMALKLLCGELPASSSGCVHGVWWLNPVLVCCPCHCSLVAHVENAVGSPRRSLVSPIRDWALLGGIMPDASKSHEPNLEASQGQWVILGSVAWADGIC